MKRYSFAPILVTPFPNMCDVRNKWIFGGIQCVINVSGRESEELKSEYVARDIEYYHFPLKEDISDIGWGNIIQAVKVVLVQVERGNPILVHCEGGNNRSPLIVEAAYFAIYGEQYNDEYKGSGNHLLYNCDNGYIPLSRTKIETELKILSQNTE